MGAVAPIALTLEKYDMKYNLICTRTWPSRRYYFDIYLEGEVSSFIEKLLFLAYVFTYQ